jgi:hypothetical protein
MSNAPPDLLAFRRDVMAVTGLTGNDVGIAADPRHLAGGGVA